MILKPEQVEKQLFDTQEYIKKQLENSIYLNSDTSDPTLIEKQLGRSFTPEEFAAKLKKLNPNLRIVHHPKNPSKLWLFYGDGESRVFISAFENIIIPEHSIFSIKEEEVPDLDVMRKRNVGGVMINHIDKRDLMENGSAAPGFKKVKVPWNEARRGWRTVLCKVLDAGYASPAQVEIIFGADNTPQWKRRMGKGNTTELW